MKIKIDEKYSGMAFITDCDVKKIVDRYSLANPEFIQAKQSGRYFYNIPTTISFAEPHSGGVRVPLPCLKTTLNIPTPLYTFGDNNFTLRDYQAVAVDEWGTNHYGILRAAAGSGKTVCGCELIRRKNTHAVVVVPTTDILKQWYKTGLKSGIKFSRLGGGYKEASIKSPAIVATFQSLIKNVELMQNTGLIIIDECHRSPCLTIRDILKSCPAKYRYGTTATPWRQDSLHTSLDWLLGGVTTVIERKDIAENVINPDIEIVHTNMYVPNPVNKQMRTDIVAYQGNVGLNDERNKRIASRVDMEVDNGHAVIVLCNRVDQIHRLKAIIKNKSVVVEGSTPKKMRDLNMESIKKGGSNVLIASYKLAGEGLDIPRLSCLVMAAPVGNPTQVEQSCGRIARPFKGKKDPLVIDFVDKDKIALRYAAKRRKVYLKLKYKFKGDIL